MTDEEQKATSKIYSFNPFKNVVRQSEEEESKNSVDRVKVELT